MVWLRDSGLRDTVTWCTVTAQSHELSLPMSYRTPTNRRAHRATPTPPVAARSPSAAGWMPGVPILLLVSSTALPSMRMHPGVVRACWAAAACLLVWLFVLLVISSRQRRTLAFHIDLRKQHYIQACAQGSIFVYWGWYWREVYHAAPMIAAQLLFAYAFDALLTWSRGDDYTLGFGPFPIIFSTNLFLWFKPDWFHLQFLMVAVGFAAKAFIRWTRDGRRVHVFNPSSFTLSLFSIGLILTGRTGMTWGADIAMTQLMPPHIYLLIFLVALPGQFLFGVASMTLAAVSTTLAFSLAYFAGTGSYYFFEPSVPIAVFLGMHLLFTDPSTAPRSELGRILFGVLYALSIVALVFVLRRAGVPAFYDKLLSVPLLNLSIQQLDRLARSGVLKTIDPARIGSSLTPRGRHVAYIGAWAVVFAAMQALTGDHVALARADVFLGQGRTEEAIDQYRTLLSESPDLVAAYNKLGLALIRTGDVRGAIEALRRAAAVQPDDAEVRSNLGLALVQAGQAVEAADQFRRAITARPDYAEARYNLAHVLTAQGRAGEAADEFRRVLRLRPEWPTAMGALAFLQATQPDLPRADVAETVRLASRAAELSQWQDVAVLDALAAAYAVADRFPDAVRTAEHAEALARLKAPHLAEDIGARLSLYRSRKTLVENSR
jgi:tetratricopeptide (TPR) repeat protein